MNPSGQTITIYSKCPYCTISVQMNPWRTATCSLPRRQGLRPFGYSDREPCSNPYKMRYTLTYSVLVGPLGNLSTRSNIRLSMNRTRFWARAAADAQTSKDSRSSLAAHDPTIFREDSGFTSTYDREQGARKIRAKVRSLTSGRQAPCWESNPSQFKSQNSDSAWVDETPTRLKTFIKHPRKIT